MLCSNCCRCQKTCYWLKDSKHHSKCVYCKVQCNILSSFLNDWIYLNCQQEELSAELVVAKTKKEIVKICKEEIWACICWLKRQKKFLHIHENEMICWSLKSFDDLNKAETVKMSTLVKSSLLRFSFNKLLFSETDLTAAKWFSS